jgi:hypothetical protein
MCCPRSLSRHERRLRPDSVSLHPDLWRFHLHELRRPPRSAEHISNERQIVRLKCRLMHHRRRSRSVQKLSRAPVKGSSCLAMIEAEHPTKSVAPPDCSANTGKSARVLQQLVTDALMIALTVVVGHVLRQCVPDPPATTKVLPEPSSRHRRAESYAVRAASVLGGLHHEYSPVIGLLRTTGAAYSVFR